MITLPSDVLALLEAGRTVVRGMVRFEFGTGTYGFIKSLTPFTYAGYTYQPGGIIQVSDFASSTGLTAQQFTISLAASPDDGLTPAVLQTIEAEDYRDRPVYIYDAHFHPDTGALLHVQTMRRGYVDTVDHEDDPQTGYTLIAQCETRALDYTRTNARKRSDADQGRRSAGDTFFEHAAKRGREEIFWGRAKEASQPPQRRGNFVRGSS